MAFFLGADFDDMAGFRGASQMMMREMEEIGEDEIMPHEDGQFVSDNALKEHWQSIFGTPEGTQHPFNTKLMTYFDDDPNKPMRVTVRGSKFVHDDLANEPMPHYVVRFRGQTELTMIHLDEAHGEGCPWQVGWDIDDAEADGGDDTQDADTRMIETRQGEGSTSTNNNPPKFRWLFDEFGGKDLDIEQDLFELASSNNTEMTLSKAVLEMVRLFVQEKLGGVIVANAGQTKFQAVEFFGPQKHSMFGTFIEIQYGISPELEPAEVFLRGEDIKTLLVPNAIAVALERHILRGCQGNDTNDTGSGLLLYKGKLVRAYGDDTTTTTPSYTNIVPYLGTIVEGIHFGIELEFSCALGMSKMELSQRLQLSSNLPPDLFHQPESHYDCSKDEKPSKDGGTGRRSNYDEISQHSDSKFPSRKRNKTDTPYSNSKWKLVSDRSLKPKYDYPNSNLLELVSRILSGQNGLDECMSMIQILPQIAAVQTNQTMGLHVHISIEGLSDSQMIHACHTFVEYEDQIDEFMPISRRNDNKVSAKYFKSNKEAILKNTKQSKTNHSTKSDKTTTAAPIDDRFQRCKSVNDLCELMNPNGDRYFKLNLQNIRLKRQPTFEFRQHPATANPKDLSSWIIFCMVLVHHPDRISDHFDSKT